MEMPSSHGASEAFQRSYSDAPRIKETGHGPSLSLHSFEHMGKAHAILITYKHGCKQAATRVQPRGRGNQ